ncbi:MAG TPA: glycosyltransferase family 87 protein [Bryobacteraceae bacterium]|nr:glycosyltransferase family 87 protein [Bryobacteraceae bacterium]
MFASTGPRRLLLIIIVAACAVWYVKQNILDVLPTPGLSDFRFYYFAAQHILHGESPFLTADYIYPPLLACLLVPIAAFDYFTARWIWFIFSHACLLTAAFLLWRRLGRNRIATVSIAFVWGAGWVAQDSFATGQPDPLLTLLIVVACTSRTALRYASAGAGFAVKLIPAVLALLAPLERNWRGLIAFFASAGLLMAIPWAIVASLRGPIRPANTDYLYGTPCVLSWSIPSIALRVIEPPDEDGKLPSDWINGWDLPRLHLASEQKLVSLAAAFVTLAAGLALLGFKTRRGLSPDQIPIAGAALIALALAASPIAWWHYQAMQYPGIAILLYYAMLRRNWRRLASSLACAIVLFPLPAAVLRYYYHQHERWPDAPTFMYFWTSVTPVASLVLFALLIATIEACGSKIRSSSSPVEDTVSAAHFAGDLQPKAPRP